MKMFAWIVGGFAVLFLLGIIFVRVTEGPVRKGTLQLREKLAAPQVFLSDALSEVSSEKRILSSHDCEITPEKLLKAKNGEVLLVKKDGGEVDSENCHVTIMHVQVGVAVFHGELGVTVDNRGRVTSVREPVFFY